MEVYIANTIGKYFISLKATEYLAMCLVVGDFPEIRGNELFATVRCSCPIPTKIFPCGIYIQSMSSKIC